MDTKNKERPHPLDLPEIAALAILVLAEGKGANQRLFTMTSSQVGHRWRLAREAADLTRSTGWHDDLRIKDLRHTFGVHYLRAGGNIATAMARFGHRRGEQTLAYAKHEARGRDDMERAAASMGLGQLPRELEAKLARPDDMEGEIPEVPVWWFHRHAGPQGREAAKVYAKRGTAGWAEDPKGYNRERMRKSRAADRERREAEEQLGVEPAVDTHAKMPNLTSRQAGHLQRSAASDCAALNGAQDWSRTSTPFRAHDPESCASTNSATWAATLLPHLTVGHVKYGVLRRPCKQVGHYITLRDSSS